MKKIVLVLFILTINLTSALKTKPVIVDSKLSFKQALARVSIKCPKWILQNQALIEVFYYGFDGKVHKGQIVADCRLARDLQHVFKIAFDLKFPIRQVKPIVMYGWNDFLSMYADNSSSFNYRNVPFTKNMSKHAYGWAIDINPLENPFYTRGKVYPEGAFYNPKAAGTLLANHPIVIAFKKCGWRWGGDWRDSDFQHFDKRLSKDFAQDNKKVYSWPWKVN